MNTTDQLQPRSKYSEKWQERFAFFDAHGAPNAPGFKEALMKLPFKNKVRVNANIIAFFFGPIYLFVLGLWKKNLTMIAILLTMNILLEIVYALTDFAYAKQLNFAVGFGMNTLYLFITNYAYYLQEVKGEQGWNPFKGMRW
ncbi:DUF2628 domain-containing protein [Pseudomonas sp. DWP3-1-2]|uniref:DUF2628 domain-containing protein n=1 Tax=Pseudomonas sp. DWP3-1-2 TaxID=2804645 RepID=UPI003CEAA489